MSLASPHLDRRHLRVSFARQRLSQLYLRKAYEQIVPIHIRVISRQEKEPLMQYTQVATSSNQKRRVA